jgi:hypothetical protein
MYTITNSKLIAILALLILMTAPAVSFARVNSVTGGLSTGVDYSDRTYDQQRDDDDDYERLFLSPRLLFRSLSERDSFELEANPNLKYDLDESDTDWDSNIRVAADRFITKEWQSGISNHYLISDSSDTGNGTSINSDDLTAPTDPQLSDDRGRQRYWRNTLSLFTNYFYAEDSLMRLDLGYIGLRNDNDDTFSDSDTEEYDRYTASLRNVHRYNAIWASTVDFGFVYGDFKQNDSDNVISDASDDLKEYRLSLALDNQSIVNNPLSLSFDYIAARYDGSNEDDNDIYQGRFTWRRDYSSRMYTNLGAGPSYSKTEGQKGNWGGNGIAEVNYAVDEHGYINFSVEKSYDVENFSGSDESGIVDTWATRLSGGYQLQSDLSLSGNLAYLNEYREELAPRLGDPDNIDNYTEDRYIAGAGLSYTFLQFYTASVDYTFTKLDSDRDRDEYDDHRILLTLSWGQELFHW